MSGKKAGAGVVSAEWEAWRDRRVGAGLTLTPSTNGDPERWVFMGQKTTQRLATPCLKSCSTPPLVSWYLETVTGTEQTPENSRKAGHFQGSEPAGPSTYIMQLSNTAIACVPSLEAATSCAASSQPTWAWPPLAPLLRYGKHVA